MPNLLLELFSEEIPARMQQRAAEDLAGLIQAKVVEAQLLDTKTCAANLKTYVTPRRLTITIDDLPEKQPDITIEKKGPKVGAPEKALEGFLKSTGQKLEELEKRTVGKDEVYFSVVQQQGRPTKELLKELLEAAISELVWPKSMRWGDYPTRWVRPLHSICCLFGADIVPVQFGHITASNVTYGHRFLAPDAITLSSPHEYEDKLKAAFVWPDFEGRKAVVALELQELAEKYNLQIRADETLLREVTGLVEYPVALLGTIEDSFMKLPHELLQVTMSTHQKYFTLEDNSGKIAPHFIFVANRTTEDGGNQIIAGNERVLRARFSDAEFFFAQDQKKPLAEWNKKLGEVTFHAKLGSVADKVERVVALTEKLADKFCGDHDKKELIEAAKLSKADLVTGLVGEFPELQGIIGSYYAKNEGKTDLVCTAIKDQYEHDDERLTGAQNAHLLCLADRLDTLISMFSIDEKPTGSKDPYALRRAGLVIIAIIRNYKLRLILSDLFPANVKADLLTFLNDRIESHYSRLGMDKNILRAIGGLQKDDDIVRVEARAEALSAFLNTEDSNAMLAAYKRAANILAAEEKKDKTTYKAADLDVGKLSEAAEKELHTALKEVSETIAPLMQEEKFEQVMQAFAKLKGPLDKFFDEIMVNSDDAVIRKNRLSLLATLVDTMHQVANFSEITG